MEIAPIDSITNQTAVHARERLREYSDQAMRRILANANYLRELAEGTKRLEIERAENAALFATFRRLTSFSD